MKPVDYNIAENYRKSSELLKKFSDKSWKERTVALDELIVNISTDKAHHIPLANLWPALLSESNPLNFEKVLQLLSKYINSYKLPANQVRYFIDIIICKGVSSAQVSTKLIALDCIVCIIKVASRFDILLEVANSILNKKPRVIVAAIVSINSVISILGIAPFQLKSIFAFFSKLLNSSLPLIKGGVMDFYKLAYRLLGEAIHPHIANLKQTQKDEIFKSRASSLYVSANSATTETANNTQELCRRFKAFANKEKMQTLDLIHTSVKNQNMKLSIPPYLIELFEQILNTEVDAGVLESCVIIIAHMAFKMKEHFIYWKIFISSVVKLYNRKELEGQIDKCMGMLNWSIKLDDMHDLITQYLSVDREGGTTLNFRCCVIKWIKSYLDCSFTTISKSTAQILLELFHNLSNDSSLKDLLIDTKNAVYAKAKLAIPDQITLKNISPANQIDSNKKNIRSMSATKCKYAIKYKKQVSNTHEKHIEVNTTYTSPIKRVNMPLNKDSHTNYNSKTNLNVSIMTPKAGNIQKQVSSNQELMSDQKHLFMKSDECLTREYNSCIVFTPIVLIPSKNKEKRAEMDKKMPWSVHNVRANTVEDYQKCIKACINHNLYKHMFSNTGTKGTIDCISAIINGCDEEYSQITSIFDLLLKWMHTKLNEKNVPIHLYVYEFLSKYKGICLSKDNKLSDYESRLLISMLVEQVSSPNKKIKNNVISLMISLTEICSQKVIINIIVEAIKIKEHKEKVCCLTLLANVLRTYQMIHTISEKAFCYLCSLLQNEEYKKAATSILYELYRLDKNTSIQYFRKCNIAIDANALNRYQAAYRTNIENVSNIAQLQNAPKIPSESDAKGKTNSTKISKNSIDYTINCITASDSQDTSSISRLIAQLINNPNLAHVNDSTIFENLISNLVILGKEYILSIASDIEDLFKYCNEYTMAIAILNMMPALASLVTEFSKGISIALKKLSYIQIESILDKLNEKVKPREPAESISAYKTFFAYLIECHGLLLWQAIKPSTCSMLQQWVNEIIYEKYPTIQKIIMIMTNEGAFKATVALKEFVAEYTQLKFDKMLARCTLILTQQIREEMESINLISKEKASTNRNMKGHCSASINSSPLKPHNDSFEDSFKMISLEKKPDHQQ